MYLQQNCVVYLNVRPSVVRGKKREDVFLSRLCCLLNCKAFGGSRFQDSIRVFDESSVVYLSERP